MSVRSSLSDVSFEQGTKVTVTLPVQNDDWGFKYKYLQMVWSCAIFNPEATIRFVLKHPRRLKPFDKTYPSICKKRKRFTGLSSIHWYTNDQFKKLVEALIRDVKTGGRDEPLNWLIKQFRGLSSHEKITEILREIQKEAGNIQHLSDLVSQDEIIFKLHEYMKRLSYEPSPDVLGEIGEKCVYDRIEQIHGSPLRFKYKKIRNVCKDGTRCIPFVLETALAIFDHDLGLQVHTGINHSSCLDNPFEGYHGTWTDTKGKDQEDSIMRGTLEKYKIDSQQPVVILVHLICPNIEYQSYGKGKINIEPFFEAIAQALTNICRFYPRFKRRKWSVSGKTSLARTYLRKELWRRADLLKQRGKIPEDERTTQQGIYYRIRNLMGGKIDIKRASLISYIRDDCEKIGKTREELGIFAAVRAEMYYRGNVYPVSFTKIRELAKKGCDIILIEKEGICQVIEAHARRKGVALVNSRGFIVDYAKDLLALAYEHNANLFLLTDMDDSGLLIAQKVSAIPRLGIDLYMLSELGLEREKVEEKYKPYDKHFKKLPASEQVLVKDTRVEIDAVVTAVGPESFWNYLEGMMELVPIRDLTRSIDLTIRLPSEISEPLARISEQIRFIGIPKQEQIKATLMKWKKGFVDVEEVEERIQSVIIEEIRKDHRTQELAKQLNKLANSISKISKKEVKSNHG